MISIYPNINFVEKEEETDTDSITENIKAILDRPIERQKNMIRKDIQVLI